MSFGTSGSRVFNFNSLFGNIGSYTQSIQTGSQDQLLFSDTIFANNMSLTSNIIRPLATSATTKIAFYIDFSGITTTQVKPGAPSNTIPLTISISESLDEGSTYPNTFVLPSVNVTYPSSDATFTSDFFIPHAGRRYKIFAYNQSEYFNITLNEAQVRIIQNPLPQINVLSSPAYFTTSSANILVASTSMSQVYVPDLPYTQIINSTNFSSSGYQSFVPFEIFPGDQIRFEGDESQVYGIISATPQFHNVPMSILLNGNVTANTNLNSFLIRRFNPNPSFITIDSDLSTYQGGGGFILPKFITNEMQESFDKKCNLFKRKRINNIIIKT